MLSNRMEMPSQALVACVEISKDVRSLMVNRSNSPCPCPGGGAVQRFGIIRSGIDSVWPRALGEKLV